MAEEKSDAAKSDAVGMFIMLPLRAPLMCTFDPVNSNIVMRLTHDDQITP